MILYALPLACMFLSCFPCYPMLAFSCMFCLSCLSPVCCAEPLSRAFFLVIPYFPVSFCHLALVLYLLPLVCTSLHLCDSPSCMHLPPLPHFPPLGTFHSHVHVFFACMLLLSHTLCLSCELTFRVLCRSHVCALPLMCFASLPHSLCFSYDLFSLVLPFLHSPLLHVLHFLHSSCAFPPLGTSLQALSLSLVLSVSHLCFPFTACYFSVTPPFLLSASHSLSPFLSTCLLGFPFVLDVLRQSTPVFLSPPSQITPSLTFIFFSLFSFCLFVSACLGLSLDPFSLPFCLSLSLRYVFPPSIVLFHCLSFLWPPNLSLPLGLVPPLS
ncbi:uncharacterized protein LOC113980953 [Neopelma chrysocephalum]|uniref:uncharacterized protein LOC113980953 n=1 Tax=Neopelma chrysocephalum TaxID=114329 RepID=UPI000FCCE7D6|nr:uncharacterized protein LOC113980953 [Neopelma chrysocephalum]